MKSEKTTTFAALVWVAGILAVILFRDAFANSTQGIVLALILACLILIATYFLVDGIWKLLHSNQEKEDFIRKAYEDKMYELLESEINKLSSDKMGNLLEKRMDKIVDTKIRRLFDEEMRKLTDGKMRKVMGDEFSKVFNEKVSKMLKEELDGIKSNDSMSDSDNLEQMKTSIRNELEQMKTVFQDELKQTESSVQDGLKQMETSIQDELKQVGTSVQDGFKQTETSVQDELKQLETTIQDNKMEESINNTTMQAAKLLVKYTNKTSNDTLRKLMEIEELLQSAIEE